jgi:hypothetical protein
MNNVLFIIGKICISFKIISLQFSSDYILCIFPTINCYENSDVTSNVNVMYEKNVSKWEYQ